MAIGCGSLGIAVPGGNKALEESMTGDVLGVHGRRYPLRERKEGFDVRTEALLRKEVRKEELLCVDGFARAIEFSVAGKGPRGVDEQEPRLLKELPDGGEPQPLCAVLFLVVITAREDLLAATLPSDRNAAGVGTTCGISVAQRRC